MDVWMYGCMDVWMYVYIHIYIYITMFLEGLSEKKKNLETVLAF